VNYLGLLGWSPRDHGAVKTGAAGDDDAELVPLGVMAERFALEDVGVHAGVFDEEKLAWVNRHYLRAADPRRIAELAVPYFTSAGISMTPDARGLTFLAAAMPIATGSIDRIDQVPARLAVLFEYDAASALADATIREEMRAEPARAVVRALADVLAGEARLIDRDRFRAAANEVKTRTGQKGRALFHPIRIALTARAQGPELDLAVPAIEAGADLPRDAGLPPIVGCRERAAACVDALDRA
jgi:glutamyl-tRNA synthetase/nondiscriminating glutamyl-tRNA synthetase